jgi:signal transduction histidine kinase/CheY-like chemotaxis protein
MRLPGFVSRTMTLREAAAVIFVLVALLPLLLVVAFLSVSNLISRTEAQSVVLMALIIACLGFVVFRRMVDQIARLAINVRPPIRADRELPNADEAAARVPGLGQIADIGQLADAFHQMLEDLRASKQRLEDLVFKMGTLNELVEMSTRIPNIEDLLASVLQSTMRAVHAKIGSIMLLDQQRKTLRIAASRGLPDEIHAQTEVRLGEGVAGKVAELGEPVIVDDIEKDARFARVNDPKYATGSFICMPVRVGDRVIGVINLAKKEDASATPPAARPFSLTDLHFLSALLTYIGYVVDHARLLQEARQSAGQLQNVVDDLRATQAQLVRGETLSAIGKLASGMAHHLNNLFAIILGRLETLQTKVPDPEARRYLDIVKRAAQDGAEVVRRVQRFSRVQPVSRTMPVDLNQLAQEVLDLTSPRWHDEALLRQIRIDTALDLGSTQPVAGELAPLREVLMNLVLNAIDAMPDGGRLGVKTWADAEGVHCDVSDSGAGMSDDVRQRALDPFFTTKGPKSTGLGLSVTYGIIQRHNGTLEIDSAPGRGTTVHITLPAARRVVGAPGPSTPTPATPAQLRVLLVDDEPNVRSALADILGMSGHTAFQAAGGREALAWLEAGQPVDLVLTDLGMPGLTGADVARAIRSRWPHLRIGLMTGWDETEGLVGEANAVVDFVIAKPFKLSALLEAYAGISSRTGTQP